MNLFQVHSTPIKLFPNIWDPIAELEELIYKLWPGSLNGLLEKETKEVLKLVLILKPYDQYHVIITQFRESVHLLISLFCCSSTQD